MVSFIDGLKGALKSAYCSEVSRSPTWFSNLRSVLVPGDLRQRADNLSNWVCDRPTGDDFPTPEFTGGQCLTSYRVDGTYVSSGDSTGSGCDTTRTWRINSATGPIGGIQVVFSPSPDIILQDGGFNTPAFDLATGGSLIPAEACGVAPTGSFRVKSMTITSVTRRDGNPDNCGNPDTVFPPVAPIETEINVDYGDDLNLTVPVIFAPVYVALDGTLRIPIRIGEINLNGEINLDAPFDITFDFSGQNDTGSADDPDLPPGDSSGDDSDPPAGPSERIIGVMVRVTDLNNEVVTVIPQSAGPAIVAPRAATVKFLARFGGLTGWTPDIPVKSVRCYVPCPIPSGAVDVQVTGDFDCGVEFTPIRGKPLTEP